MEIGISTPGGGLNLMDLVLFVKTIVWKVGRILATTLSVNEFDLFSMSNYDFETQILSPTWTVNLLQFDLVFNMFLCSLG